MTERDLERLQRHSLWNSQPQLFEAVLRILFECDPVGICFEGNPKRETEYICETERIICRLPDVRSPRDFDQLVSEVFTQCFVAKYGHLDCCGAAAAAIWQMLVDFGWMVKTDEGHFELATLN